MSDRIAVMSAGEVQQIGTAEDVYEHPANRFVADFIGDTNLMETVVEAANGQDVSCRLGGATITALAAGEVQVGQKGWLSIRPERLSLSSTGNGIAARIDHTVYLGTDTQALVRLDDGLMLRTRMQNSVDGAERAAAGAEVCLTIAPGAARFLVE